MSKMSDLDIEAQERLAEKIDHLKELGMYKDYMDTQIYREQLKEEFLRDIALEQGELSMKIICFLSFIKTK